MPYTTGFMGNLMNMMQMDNVRMKQIGFNFIHMCHITRGDKIGQPSTLVGSTRTHLLKYKAYFLLQEDYAGSQVALPYPGFMKNSAMNMVSVSMK